MLPQRQSLPTVTAAGVVAILFAALTILFSLLMQIVLVALPNLGNRPNQAPMPPGTRMLGGIFWFFVLLIGVGELFIAVNVLRRRNWARIAILIWAGIMAFFSAISCIGVLLILSLMPNSLTTARDAGPVLLFMKFFMLIFYGVPVAIGIWWLVLFTRPRVVAAFKSPQGFAPAPMALDASGFPAPPPVAFPAAPKKPSCPVPLLVVAGLLLASAVSTPIAFLLPSTPSVPMFFFGFTTTVATGRLIVGALAVINGILAIGLIRLKPLSLDALLALQTVLLINGIFSLTSPNFIHIMHEAMAQVAAANPNLPPGFAMFSDGFFRAILVFSLLFSLCIISVLVGFRSRFVKAAAETAA